MNKKNTMTEKEEFEESFRMEDLEKILDDYTPTQEEIDEYNENFLSSEEIKEIEQEAILNAQENYERYLEQESKTFDGVVEKYSTLINLHGNSYRPITKMIFYSVIANQFKTNMFSMESDIYDLRINLMIMMEAGHGKKNFASFIKRTINGIGKLYVEPTSYHPEQFVGKVVTHETEGEILYQLVPGFLSSDFILIDEAYSLFKLEKHEECLTYIRTALDQIGRNTITKKQVNIPNEHSLKYDPNCTMIMLTQPLTQANEELVSRGSFRRFIILVAKIPQEERDDARRKSKFFTMNIETYNKMWEDWINLNKLWSTYRVSFTGRDEDLKLIDIYLDDIAQVAKNRGKEVLKLYNTAQFTMKQIILKMCAVRALVMHDITKSNIVTISRSNIQSAIKDWQAVWEPQIAWIAQQMKIESDLPIGWDNNHQWIVDKLSTNKDMMLMGDLVEMYCDVFKGSGKQETLQTKCYRKIEQLYKWGMVKRELTGDGAKKRIKLV